MGQKDVEIAILIISLKKLQGVGNKTIQHFLVRNRESIMRTCKYTESYIRELENNSIIKGLDTLEESWNQLLENVGSMVKRSIDKGIRIVHPFMEEYPQNMLEADSFPPILYCRGNIMLLNSIRIVTIVGTRTPTEFSYAYGKRIAEVLAEKGSVIVSGLAKGIDESAHSGALNVKGNTIAILPTSIDGPIYPQENRDLANQIIEQDGLLISEYEPERIVVGKELVSNLVARDRWQASLCDGLIVVETSKSGGSRHAVGHAEVMKRPIATLDFRKKIEGLENCDRFSGNMYYILQEIALPIYSLDSVEQFIENVDIQKVKRKKNSNPFEMSNTDIHEQIKLF